jgi:hypothetical protein
MKSYSTNNFLETDAFNEVHLACVEKSKSFRNIHYASGYGRYGVFIDFSKEIEDIFVKKAREAFKTEDLFITYIQLVKYQIVENNIPRLTPHIDDLPGTRVIDLCVDTTLSNWGLLVNDTLFIDTPNTAIFLYGQEEIHSRPEYTSNSPKDYSLQLLINFAPKNFWFFKGDYKKALKYVIPSPVMYGDGVVTQS